MNRYTELAEALRPLLKERTEAVLEEALRRVQKPPEALDRVDLERILKRVVYPELARRMPTDEARAKVEALLSKLLQEGGHEDELKALEKALKTYSLYIDWPEVQRLRRLVSGLRVEWDPEAAAEARAVLKALEEKFESRLVQQARAISEIEGSFQKVKKVGGRKVKRLANLLEQLKAAQRERILAGAELEQARQLASELLKLVESSVVDTAEEEGLLVVIEEDEPLELDLENLTPEQQNRIREIDRIEEGHRLRGLAERYAAVLERTPWRERYQALLERNERGEVLGDALEAFEAELKEAEEEMLAEARARFEWIAEKLREAEALGEQAAGLWAQLTAVEEALQKGVLPEGLAELEEAAEAHLRRARARKEAEAKVHRLAEEARAFAEEARARLDAARYPRLAEDLERLLAQAEAGEVEEAFYQDLKGRLPAALSDRADALAARLQALPELPELLELKKTAEVALQAGNLDEAEEAIARLEAEARARIARELERLKLRAERFGLELSALKEAEAELAAGRIPPLEALSNLVEEGVAAQQRRARARLARIRSEAERYLGLGGEALLAKLAEAEEKLAEGLPDFEGLEAELRALVGRREAFRKSLADRYARLAEGFARYKGMTGETRSRLGAMMGFLEQGFARLDRLGTEGLLELDRALSEAEPLLRQLAEEYRAARELASELEGAQLEELLGVFEAPASKRERLAPFRRRGVLAAAWLGEEPEGEPPVDPVLIQALKDEVRAAGPARLVTLYLPEHVFLVAFFQDGDLVLLAEKPLLSRLIELLKEAAG